MKQKAFGTSSAAGEELLATQDLFNEQLPAGAMKEEPPRCALDTRKLAAHCLKEIDNFHKGEPFTDVYGIELLRRATVLGEE